MACLSLFERVLIELGELEVGILVPALQKVVGKRPEQILHLDAEIFFGEFRVGDTPHKVIRFFSSDSGVRHRVRRCRVEAHRNAAAPVLRVHALAGYKLELFVPADTFVRV